MKFILVLYFCSFASQPICDDGQIAGQYKTWKECASNGYKKAGERFAFYPEEKINKHKMAIRFECKQLGEV